MVDRHVVKMILESAQLLSTAHRVLDHVRVENKILEGKKRQTTVYILDDARDKLLYMASYINHPSAIWCRSSIENYNWLAQHFHALLSEYTHRYNKIHMRDKSEFSRLLSSPPKNLKQYEWTAMPCCMDQQYIISDDPVINYRNYYKFGKQHLHSWKNRQPPQWINGD